MKPVVCFFENKNYIYSVDYELHQCSALEKFDNFICEIENKYSDQLKIVQFNFECFNQSTFEQQKPLYPVAAAHVFILNDYLVLTETELLQKLLFTNTQVNQWTLLESSESFKNKIKKIKNEIQKGRIYQVNLTSALQTKTQTDALMLFRQYFQNYAGEHKAYLPLPEVDVLSFSPELFLRKNGSYLRTKPIKGSAKVDADFKNILLDNKKEDAELSMIVDLLRNDLNKTNPLKPAQVVQHRSQLKLGYIQHTYSEIEIMTEKNLPEILSSCFPGGSISGCPKTESLQLISELENIKRQIYTGAIGWWQNNNFELNLAIRTFIKHQDNLFYHSGCGVVFDSDPEQEWQEFLMKTGNLNL